VKNNVKQFKIKIKRKKKKTPLFRINLLQLILFQANLL
jgi:hypothetical protein